ncbi:MAG: VWA domain-containing protein [Candidatus Sulfotelmatobacter sp.]
MIQQASMRFLSFLTALTAFCRQISVSKALVIFVVFLSSSETIGQEIYGVSKTHSLDEENKSMPSAPTRYAGTFRVNVDLVLVPVTVTDTLGRSVAGLGKENFEIYEGKEKQEIRTLSSEDSPISMGILFDTSGSMSGKIEQARQAVTELLETSNPEDEFFLITFANTPELVADFTNSAEDLQSRLLSQAPRGSTALLDAIYLGISKMRKAKYARKALLVISDGGDNHSRYHEREIKSMVRESDALVYAIGIYDYSFPTMEEQLGPALLSELSEESGGQMFSVDNLMYLRNIATKISIELRNQYVLGYHPTDPKYDGKWHKIKVKLVPPTGMPRLDARAKEGYYAPSE